ncbi:MAG: hypothetical protein HY094_09385 [Candidatus Melainabacteria bacterium]|nr:hypothetical protein [Candidatus Melainabacteria bacterium]
MQMTLKKRIVVICMGIFILNTLFFVSSRPHLIKEIKECYASGSVIVINKHITDRIIDKVKTLHLLLPAAAGGGGDPHFIGFVNAGKQVTYDVQGDPNKIYNILSDKDLQFNARFLPFFKKGANIMGEFGIKIGSSTIDIKRDDSPPRVNNKPMKLDEIIRLEDGSVSWYGKNLLIKTKEYSISISREQLSTYPFTRHLDFTVSVNKCGVLQDGVAPHGLLGQTASGCQGKNTIQGNYKDYEVSDLFGDDFKYNRYDPIPKWVC